MTMLNHPTRMRETRSVFNLLARACVAQKTRNPRADLSADMDLPETFNHEFDLDNLRQYQSLTGEQARRGVWPLGYYYTQAFMNMADIVADGNYPLPMFGTLHKINFLQVDKPVGLNTRSMRVSTYLRSFEQSDRYVTLDFHSRFFADHQKVADMTSKTVYRNRRYVKSTKTQERPDLLGSWNKVAGITIPKWDGLRFAITTGDWNPAHYSKLWAKKVLRMDGTSMQSGYSTAVALANMGDHPALREGCGIVYSEYLKPLYMPATHELYRQEEGSKAEFAIYDPRIQRVSVKGYVQSL